MIIAIFMGKAKQFVGTRINNGYVLKTAKHFDSAGLLIKSSQFDMYYSNNSINERDLLVPGEPIDTVHTFVANGDLEKQTTFDLSNNGNGNGELLSTLTFTRSSTGRLLSAAQEFGSSSESEPPTLVFDFDYTNNLLTSRALTINDEPASLLTFSYDAENLLESIQQKYFSDPDTGNIDTVTISYNGQNQPTGFMLDVLSDGAIDHTLEYSYNADGNVESYSNISESGALINRGEFTYDSSINPAPNLMNHYDLYFPLTVLAMGN